MFESVPGPLIVFLITISVLAGLRLLHFMRRRRDIKALFAALELLAEERRLKGKLLRMSEEDGLDRRKILPFCYGEQNFKEMSQLYERSGRLGRLVRDIVSDSEFQIDRMSASELLQAENKLESARLKLFKSA